MGTGGGDHPTHVLYRSLLAQEKIQVSFLSDKAPIRFNFEINDRKYNHPGFEEDLASFPKLMRSVKRGDLLVLTGRLPMGMNDGLYASWVRAFGRKGVRVAVDASGRSLTLALKAKPWFFKVNLFEFSEAVGRKIGNLGQLAKSLEKLCLSRGLEHGAVTDGPNGAIVWRGREVYHVRGRSAGSKLVVGAGDGFLAGYLWCLQKRMDLRDSARNACALAATIASHGIHGFDQTDVLRTLKSVKIRRPS
jgi:fructose-1-phosphate kinase PfkB-like protein